MSHARDFNASWRCIWPGIPKRIGDLQLLLRWAKPKGESKLRCDAWEVLTPLRYNSQLRIEYASKSGKIAGKLQLPI